jgi:phosphoribosyl 1,2-cyclic phosphodiesterase
VTSLIVLGSGSKGNAFALIHQGTMLLLDAGFSLKELDRRLQAAGLSDTPLAGIAITHEHGDHASAAVALARRHSAPLIASFGTWRALAGGDDPCDFLPVSSRGNVTVGAFTLTACPTSHDAAEPIALGITLPHGLSIGVAYDLGRPTQAIRWFLRERHCLVLEANHDEVLLRTSKYPPVVQQRIAGPGGHLSNDDAARLLEEVHSSNLEAVVLCHVSQRCNSAEAARAAVAPGLAARGFRGMLVVAEQMGPMAPLRIAGPAQASLFV